MAKTNMGSISLTDGYQTKKCIFYENFGLGSNPENGSGGVKLHIYKTSSGESIAMATKASKADISTLNPPSPLLPVVAKINGNFFDYKDFTGAKSFYGLHLASGQLSMEGLVGITANAPDAQQLYNNHLYEDNFCWYSPSLCINWNDSLVEIRWPRYAAVHTSSQDILSVPEAVAKYNRIIGGVACLVYKGKSVFDSTAAVKSVEGYRLADFSVKNASDTEKRHQHYNFVANIWGGYRFRRTLLGHHPDGYFLLIVVEGCHDTESTESTYKTAKGMNLEECSWMLQELGCDYAMSMDSGSPTQMRVNNSRKFPTDNKLVTQMGSAVCVYKKKVL